ncbi:pyridoxamine 5'-phosphate oxidase family protein [Pseudomonas aeruginosa]
MREPRALALATVDGQGRPSTRIVVIAELGERGVVFATHADSQKGRELAAPAATACASRGHWPWPRSTGRAGRRRGSW